MPNYSFKQWNDGDPNPQKTVNVQGDMTLTAMYEEVTSLVTKTFIGEVQFQAQAGETVTVTITSPTAVVTTKTALTNATGNFSVTADLVAGNGYTAVAHVDADGVYNAADSPVLTFNVVAGLLPRTITLTVS